MKRLVIAFINVIIASMLLSVYGETSKAEVSVKACFASAPALVFPAMSESDRLDMIDYFEGGYNRPTLNAFGDSCRVTYLDDESIDIEVSPVLKYQLVVLSHDRIMLISTHSIPQPDSEVAFYDMEWNKLPVDKCFAVPVLSDWLTATGKKNREKVEDIVPFMIVGCRYDVKSGVLTLTNNLKDYFVADDWGRLNAYFHATLQYKWNGKSFKKT